MRASAAAVPTDAGASMTVAHAIRTARPLLGLDRPLRLLGGGRLRAAGAEIFGRMAWAPALGRLVMGECDGLADAGAGWARLPPIALGGPDGGGRTHAAKVIAASLGLPFVEIDVSRTGGTDFCGWRGEGFSMSLPHPVATAIALTGCANPVVLLSGIERAGVDVLEEVVDMIDAQTAARWHEHRLDAKLDLSAVIWFLRCANPDVLRWRRTRPIGVEIHVADDALWAMSIVQEAADDLGAAHLDVPLFERTMSCLRYESTAAAKYRRAVSEILGTGRN